MPQKSGDSSLSPRERMLGIGGAAVLGLLLVKNGAQTIVGHPEEEFGHRAVYRHEEQLDKMNVGLSKLAETIDRLERERVTREERDRQEADRQAKATEDARRAFWQKERAESDAKLAEMIQRALTPTVPSRREREP